MPGLGGPLTGDFLYLEGEIDAERLINFERAGGPGNALAESHGLGAHLVMTDGKLEHLVETLAVGDGLFGRLRVEVDYDDLGAGDHRTAGIRDIPGNFAGGVLSPSGGRQEQQ